MPAPRYAIITGSASGLGRALAVRLARDGWHLGLADVDHARNAETLRLAEAAGGSGQLEPLDVASASQWQALAARLQQAWPRLDLLVNNAGVAASGAVGNAPLDDWRWLLEVNLWGVIHGCHTFVPWLKANPQGAHVINVASLAGLIAAPEMGTYCVAKAGVVALSEAMYAELRGADVGVTVVCPGFFPTNLGDRARFGDEVHREFFDRINERSRLTADAVAEAAVRGMRRKKLYVVVPRRARVLWRLKRWMPMVIARLLAWDYARRAADESAG
ncbi:MAG TPA: SDR family NAD(P)-dependent oxidoreductase [Pirellulales bacterium]|jgi:NAD(P)-dependent dehydrogenase (short-subunit alcohol dehydrogenase family)|nr:SDR family NAD(P)-dependent oxidoreductase [Pirellulales bacterium]